MARAWDERDFQSWEKALEGGQLDARQLALLDAMVESGEAASREEAAQRLDWQETVIDPVEHMYGF